VCDAVRVSPNQKTTVALRRDVNSSLGLTNLATRISNGWETTFALFSMAPFGLGEQRIARPTHWALASVLPTVCAVLAILEPNIAL
jgi:hypothetical protein